jgi:uncharacterized protein YciI
MRSSGCAALLLAFGCATAPTPAPAKAAPDFEKYQLVLLVRGPGYSPGESPALQELQKAHLAHLQAMAESGKMVIAGPFGDQPDPAYRGLCLYRVGSVEEARALAEADPMVKAGRLRALAMTWYVERGHMAFPRAPAH